MLRDLAAVIVGGVIGTALRLMLDAAIPHDAAGFPWSTLMVNLSGAFLLGLLVGGLWTRPGLPHWLRAGVGTGLLGSFTTFSAVAVGVVAMTAADAGGPALAYLGVSLLAGLGAAVGGLRLGSLWAGRGMPSEISDEGQTL